MEVEKRDAFLQEKGERLREKNEQILDSIRTPSTSRNRCCRSRRCSRQPARARNVIFRPYLHRVRRLLLVPQRHGKVFLAVVDCTGHGVPGAFMSMIGGSLLRSIIVERGVTDPAVILDELNAAVQETLQQTAERLGAQDGMDAHLCVFDLATGAVTFAGAKRPLCCRGGATAEARGTGGGPGVDRRPATPGRGALSPRSPFP